MANQGVQQITLIFTGDGTTTNFVFHLKNLPVFFDNGDKFDLLFNRYGAVDAKVQIPAVTSSSYINSVLTITCATPPSAGLNYLYVQLLYTL